MADSENFYTCESWRHEVPAGDPRRGARGYCGSDRAGGVGSWLSERSRISKKALKTRRLCMSGGARASTSKRKLLGWKSARAWFQRVKGLSWPARLGDVEGWRALRQNLSSSLHEALGRSSEVICVNSIPQENHALAQEGHVGTLSSSRRSFLMPTVLMWRCHCNVFLLYCAFAADSCQPHFTRSLCSSSIVDVTCMDAAVNASS